MTPEKSPRLAEAVERLTDTLKVVDDTLSGIRSEISWVISNRNEVARIIHAMPRDPADPAWAEKLAAMNGEPAETVSCAECDTHYDSLAEAARAGAERITEDRSGLSWNWLCVCSSCTAAEAEADARTAARLTKAVPKTPQSLFSLDQ